jgi:ABC-type dipeptide/oligopeptide/nickel transport system permease component
MLRFAAIRVLQSLIALAMLSVVVFALARATGDPLQMILPMNATEEDYANARAYLGLDRPSSSICRSSARLCRAISARHCGRGGRCGS